MGVPELRDWFNISAAAGAAAMLFSMAVCVFAVPSMSMPYVEFWSIIGSVAIAFFVWFSGAKAQQREREAKEREREAKEHERVVMLRFDELTQLLAKSGTTLEDVKVLVGDQAHFEGRVVDRESSGFR